MQVRALLDTFSSGVEGLCESEPYQYACGRCFYRTVTSELAIMMASCIPVALNDGESPDTLLDIFREAVMCAIKEQRLNDLLEQAPTTGGVQ